MAAFAVCAPLWRGIGGQGGAAGDGERVRVRGHGHRAQGLRRRGRGELRGLAEGVRAGLDRAGRTGNDTNIPAVTSTTVYVASTYGVLLAFDAKGVAGCSGTPKTCTTRWTADLGADLRTGHVRMQPSVVNGLLFIGFHGPADPPTTNDRLVAFDAGGAFGCTGAPKRCVPVGTRGPPASRRVRWSVANRRVVVGRFTFQLA